MPKIRVNIQFFSMLDGELTRQSFTAAGSAEWKQEPPLTVNQSVPAEGIAELEERSTVDATYWRNDGNVTFFVTVTQTHGQVQAFATANKVGYTATAHVSGAAPNFVVAVNFKKQI